jgi:proline iminopeptidase
MRSVIFILLIGVFQLAAQVKEEGLREVNGTKLYVTVRGQGEPLVVIHGGPGLNHKYFINHLNGLEENFKVIYYDQRASGLSAIPSADSISIKFLINDLETLRQQFKIKKLNILSHSWGVVIALHYTLANPGNIKKLIISNPALLSREYDQVIAAMQKKRITAEDSLARVELMSAGEMDVKKYEDFFLLSFKSSAYNPKNLLKLKLDLQPNFAEANKALFTGLSKDPAQQVNLYNELDKLKFPVMLIHAEADIVPPASLEKMKNNLDEPTIKIFEKSGHFPFIEENKKFNDEVIRFLKAK